MEKNIKRVVIVGGGTTGWLAAGMLAARLGSSSSQQHPIDVVLLASPEVSTVGVGEGSWPSLRDTLQEIGITESQFLTTCHASFKQGSSFINWRYDSHTHQYQHPFTTPTGYTEFDTHACWQQLASDEAYANSFCLQPAMCALGKAPKQRQTPDYAYVLNYGYHFDATALATLLSSHCTERLGVKYHAAHIESVCSHPNGAISSLVTIDGQRIEGDLFLDCSGRCGLLIDKHYRTPWHSVSAVLQNDSAVAVQAPYPHNDNAIASTTLATAHDAGWIWDIGLQHRRGVGCVFSSSFVSQQNAEEQLLHHLQQHLPSEQVSALSVRHLHFQPGYREQFWVHNCLSLGMSSGFIEPLEASAIAMVELGLRMLCDEFPVNGSHMHSLARRYNRRFSYRWARVVDFLKLHYVLSERSSAYWQEHRNSTSIPDSLTELLDLWRYQPPSRYDLIENEEIFPSASYQYVLYGMEFNTALRARTDNSDEAHKARSVRKALAQTRHKFEHGLPDNRSLLNQIRLTGDNTPSIKV
ncbi:tryptophan halogenase family protein [Alteromonas halophila]|uniref:Tryptophan halogenase n=1 Tax=Alteromonas halophila TaxID=516698 RepID=A0A918MVP7_9ALTE|nr:tryptophan halogenase family protein [Alteromonas halophila]GGW75763.1 tryptophan halogenase [Alteromonas halophila]